MRGLFERTLRSAARVLCAATLVGGMVAAASAQTTYTSTNVPLPIPPGAPTFTSGTTQSTLTVPDVGTIGDVTVSVDLQHTYIGDLLVSITSPGGTVVRLMDGGGVGNGNDISSGAPPYVFSDAHSAPVTGSDSSGGNFKPIDSLSSFDGENPNGTWTLSIQDRLNGDHGQLNSWSITITQGSINWTFAVDGTGTGNGSFNGGGSSTISCTVAAGNESGTCSEIVPDGTQVVITAGLAADTVFAGWAGCDSPSDLQCTQTVSGGDETVQARFELRRQFSVTGAGNGRGTVADLPNGIDCDWDGSNNDLSGSCGAGIADGTTFNLTATPGANSAFSSWSGCDSVSSNPNECQQVVSGGDETVTANFVRTAFVVGVSKSPSAGGTASGGGTYPAGSSVTVVATPNSGYRFVKWTEGGTQVSTNASYTFSANADRSLVANFALLPTTAPQNDLLADFGAHGLWQFRNNATWQNIHSNNPYAIGTGDLDGSKKDEALATLYSDNLAARYNNANPWKTLHPEFAKFFVAGDFDGNGKDDLAADFGSKGIWVLRNNGSTWARWHTSASQGLAVGDVDGDGRDDLIADLGAAGLWIARNNSTTWTRLHTASPVYVATGDFDGNDKDEVIIDLGSSGIFVRSNNAGSFVKLLSVASQGIATGDLDGDGRDDLIVDRGTTGLWVKLAGGAFSKSNPGDASAFVAADLDRSGKDELIASFGDGVFARFNNAGAWRRLHGWAAQGLAVGGFD